MFCRIYQWQIEKEIDYHGWIKNPRLLKHIKKCSSCRNWTDSLIYFKRQLKTSRFEVSDLVIKHIQETVFCSLSEGTSNCIMPIADNRHKVYKIRYTVTAAAMIMFIFALFYLQSSEYDKKNDIKTMDSITQISRQFEYQTFALATLPEKMIESELQTIQNDFEQSVELIHNCLPKGFLVDDFLSK